MGKLKSFFRNRFFWVALAYAAGAGMQAAHVPEPIAMAIKAAISATAGEVAKD